MRMRKLSGLWLLGGLALILFGCTSSDHEMAGGNIQAINHTVHAINWLSVNGYRAHGGGGSSCCIIMPTKWRPDLKANIEWEVDPNPSVKLPPVTSSAFREAYAKHAASYTIYSNTVDIPEWPDTESCDLKVHFLTCNRVKVTTACAVYGRPNYPIKEPMQMKEPTVCQK